jgi:hypothetical protein
MSSLGMKSSDIFGLAIQIGEFYFGSPIHLPRDVVGYWHSHLAVSTHCTIRLVFEIKPNISLAGGKWQRPDSGSPCLLVLFCG